MGRGGCISSSRREGVKGTFRGQAGKVELSVRYSGSRNGSSIKRIIISRE